MFLRILVICWEDFSEFKGFSKTLGFSLGFARFCEDLDIFKILRDFCNLSRFLGFVRNHMRFAE